MLLDLEMEQYLLERRTRLLAVLYNFFLYIFFFLLLNSFLKYLYFKTTYSYLILCFFILSFFLIYIFKKLLNRNALYASLYIILLFFSLTILSILTRGLVNPTSIICMLINYVLVLILIDRKYCIYLILLYILSLVVISLVTQIELFVKVETAFEYRELTETFSSLLFLLYLIHYGFLICGMCNTKSLELLNKYKYLAELEYRDDLLGKVSKYVLHDIVTPLSVLSGAMKVKNCKEVEVISRESLKYIERVLEDSLLLVKDQYEDCMFCPNRILKRMISIINLRIKNSKISIDMEVKGRCKIRGNECCFSRMILNIIINAIEELEQTQKKEKKIWIKSKISSKEYILSIKDNGRGIDKDVIESLGKYEYSNGKEKSIGVGLIYVYDVVKNHFKGDILIQSEKNNNTDIEIRIPLI